MPTSTAMLAFMLNEADARRLKRVVNDPEEDLHLTLAILPEGGDDLKSALSDFARNLPPVTGRISGIGRFTETDQPGMDCLYASFDAIGLPDFRQAVVEAVVEAGITPIENHGFTPHITLAYLPHDQPLPDLLIPSLELTFRNLTLVVEIGRAHV